MKPLFYALENQLHLPSFTATRPMALKDYLTYCGFSDKLIKKLRLGDSVLVNGRQHRMIDLLQPADKVVIYWPKAPIEKSLPPNKDLAVPILFEDNSYVAFDKPADLPIHPSARHYYRSLGNYFAYLYPGLSFHPIGRLDKDTSGICLVAKNPYAAALANQSIKKKYYGIIQGNMMESNGTINLPIVRLPGHTIKRQVDPEGQVAITHFHVLKKANDYSLLELILETGRTHQIRAHFAHFDKALVGDRLYGGSLQIINRQALHCGWVEFFHPITKELVTILSPLPPDLDALLSP